MTYEEALKALELAQVEFWEWKNPDMYKGIAQAIEVFKRMKVDLDIAQEVVIKLQGERG